MTRKIEVVLLGDSAQLERTFARAGASARGLNTSLERTSLSVRHVGESFRFLAASLVGGVGLEFAFETVIKAASGAESGQRSLAAQLRANRESFAASRVQIEKASLSVAKYGFTTEDSTAALTVLDRATKDISKSIKLQGIVADLARAKNISLAAAGTVVAKVFGGQTTALRRAVPGLDKHAKGLDLIYRAGRKLAGQAAANTTAEDKFHASLHNTEVTIGNGILPVLEKQLEKMTAWLDKSKNQKRIQDDVNAAAKTGAQIIGTLSSAAQDAAGVIREIDKVTGSFKNTLEGLVLVMAGVKFAGFIGGIRGIGIAAGESSAAGQVGLLTTRLRELARIGTISLAFKFPGLANGLSALAALGFPGAAAAAVALGGTLASSGSASTDIPSLLTTGASKRAQLSPLLNANKIPGNVAAGLAKRAGLDPSMALGAALNNPKFVDLMFKWAQQAGLITNPRGPVGITSPTFSGTPPGLQGITTAPSAKAFTAAQQLRLSLLAHPDNIGLLRQQAAADRAAIAFATKRRDEGKLSNKKFLETVTGYYSDLDSTLGHITELTSAAARAALAKLRAAIPRTVSGEGPSGFLRLPHTVSGAGALPGFEVPKLLQIAAARAGTTVSLADDLRIAAQTKSFSQKAIAAHSKMWLGQIDAYNTIAAQNDILGKKALDVSTFKKVSARALAKGLGLSGANERALIARLSQVGPDGRIHGAGSGAFGASDTQINNIFLDGHKIEQHVTKRQQTRARRNPPQKRGPYAGQH